MKSFKRVGGWCEPIGKTAELACLKSPRRGSYINRKSGLSVN